MAAEHVPNPVDAARRPFLQLALPDLDHEVTFGSCHSPDLGVTSAVPGDLRSPVSDVRLRDVAAAGTSMPKASVNEHRDLRAVEDEIRRSHPACTVETPPADAGCRQQRPKTPFCRPVPSRRDCRHVAATARWRCRKRWERGPVGPHHRMWVSTAWVGSPRSLSPSGRKIHPAARPANAESM